jgi:hypothetical protein
MTHSRIRGYLALMVVGVFMVITAFMAIYPIITKQPIQIDYADFFAKTSSVYTGIVGVIIGYYFGKAVSPEKGDKTGGENPES